MNEKNEGVERIVESAELTNEDLKDAAERAIDSETRDFRPRDVLAIAMRTSSPEES